MPRLTKVSPQGPFRLYLEFSDGVRGEVDLSTRLFGPVFEPLRVESYFAQVSLDAHGAPCWPNGADLAPDGLYEKLQSQLSQSASSVNGPPTQ